MYIVRLLPYHPALLLARVVPRHSLRLHIPAAKSNAKTNTEERGSWFNLSFFCPFHFVCFDQAFRAGQMELEGEKNNTPGRSLRLGYALSGTGLACRSHVR